MPDVTRRDGVAEPSVQSELTGCFIGASGPRYKRGGKKVNKKKRGGGEREKEKKSKNKRMSSAGFTGWPTFSE